MKLWLGGSTIVIPTVIAVPGANRHLQGVFSLGPVGWGSWRTLLLWLMLSHIGTDVLDEWVFGFQGTLRGLWPSHPPTTTFNVQNGTYFFKKSKTNFSNVSLRFLTARSLSWYFSHLSLIHI